MKLRLVLFLWLAAGSALGEPRGGSGLQHFLMADVFGTALTFMAPRTLDPIPVGDLTVWGLHGITAIDPSLTSMSQGDQIVLKGPQGVVLSLPQPAPDDAAGWGETAATLAEAAATVSPAIQQAGTSGMIRSFFEEMFNHLDPYSRYVGPVRAETDRELRGGVGGIGLTLGPPAGRHGHQILVVAAIMPGSPADLAGVKLGDQIASVDGHGTRGQPAARANEWLVGDVGSTAEIVVRHPGDRDFTTIDIGRVLVPPVTVSWKRNGNLMLITVTSFSADTAGQLSQAVADAVRQSAMPRRPVQGIVLDLRDNRGGLLRQAAEAADLFETHGIIISTRGRAPDSNHDFLATPDDPSHGLPVVVLVDGRTASAAEILAASLADNRRGVVVGSTTLGKGLVQTILQLPNGGELFVTWSRVVAPRGWPIQGLGVLPQVCTSNGDQMLMDQLAALAAGHQPMAQALARERAARSPIPSVELLDLRAPCPAADASDSDLPAAHWLIDHPEAYNTALLPPVAGQTAPVAPTNP